jgi:hypothetical protein
MSEISVVVVGSTSVNSVVGNGDTVNVTVGGDSGAINIGVGGDPAGSGYAATIEAGTITTIDATQTATITNAGTAYAAKFNFALPRGYTGLPGPATTLSVGSVTTGTTAAVSITGSAPSQQVSFVLPRGPAGPTNSLTVGSVTTGTTAAVSITGTAPSQQVSFVLPLGPQGATGPTGKDGAIPQISIGNVSTVSSGSSATVTATPSNGGANVTLDFGIPRGANGTGGSSSSLSLSDATPSALGTASAGTSTLASRSDHVHAVPTISYANLTNVPSNFPTNTALVSGLQSALDAKQPAGNCVTGVNNLTGNLTLAAGSNVNLSTAGSVLTISANTPTISYANLTNVPSTFAPSAHNHTANQITDFLSAVAAASPVTAVANRTGSITLTAADISGLDAAISSSSASVIDGGDYVGKLLYGITFGTQPQSVTVNSTTSVNLASASFFGSSNMARYISSSPLKVATLANGVVGAQITAHWRDSQQIYTEADLYIAFLSGYGEELGVLAHDTVSYATPGYTPYDVIDLPVSSATNGTRTVIGAHRLGYSDSPTNVSSWSFLANNWNNPFQGGYTVAHNGVRFAAVLQNFLFGTFKNVYDISALSSSDGVNWTARYLPGPSTNTGIFSGACSQCRKPLIAVNGVFVTCGHSTLIVNGAETYYPTIWTSSDGVSWTQTQFGNTASFYDGQYTPALDVFSDLASSGTLAVGVTGTTARYSTNGSTWGTATLPVSCNRVSYAVGFFWAFNAGSSGTDVCYSQDGRSWTLGTMPVSAKWDSIAGASSGFAAGATAYATATIGTSYASANLTVSATNTGGGSISYQWQQSLDAGTNWSNVSNATNTTLSLSNLTQADNGTRYRAVASSTGAALGYSQSATLTVTG